MAESSLLFQHSQRESSSPILAICIDSSTGNFITHDEKATRLWNLKKMLKSTRIERKEDNKFLELLCLDRIERILVLFTPKASVSEKGGSIQILSLNLARIQSIKLDYYSISRFSISPSQTEVLLVDKHRSVFTVHVEFLLNTSTPTAAANAKALSAAEMYHPKKSKPPPCMKLHEVQTIDMKKTTVIDALMVNDNILAIMGDKSVRLYSRPEVVYVPPPVAAVVAASVVSKPTRKKWISKKDKAAMIAAGIDPNAEPGAEVSAEPSAATLPSADPSVQKYNAFTRTGKLNIFHGRTMGIYKLPTVLRLAGKDKLMIGFDDGSLKVLFCPALLDPSTVRKTDNNTAMQITLGSPKPTKDEKSASHEPAEGTLAAVLCEFQAHFVADHAGSVPGTADINLGTGQFTENDLALGGSSLEGSFLDDMSEGSKDPTAVGRSIKPSKIGIRAALMCPWAACSGTTNGKGYQFELLTVGSDRRIAHWGVRFKEEHEDVMLVPHFAAGATRASTAKIAAPQITDENTAEGEEETWDGPDSSVAERSIAGANIPMESDLLGEYQLPQEPPTHIEAGSSESLLMMAFELALVQNPICKKIVCVVGGMLMFFDALQPHRIFVGRKPELEKAALGVTIGTTTQTARATRNDVSVSDMHTLILASAKGPELSTMVNRVGGQFREHSSEPQHTQSTMLVLRAHSVEIVLVQSGDVLQYLPTSNLQDAVLADPAGLPLLSESTSPTKKGMGRQGHLPLSTQMVRSSSATFKEVRDVEGKPTAVHFCPITHLILVGYNTGGVGLLALSGAIHSTFSKAPFAHLRTNISHGSDITKIITFHHTLKYRSAAPGGPPPPTDVVVALLGDANGVISLWQIYPAVKKGSLLLSVSQGHSARIVHAHCCLLDENASHRIIVTACAQGIVKAWKLEGNGSLVLTAFFSVDLNGARLTSALAIPSIYYETEQEDFSSNKSATGSLSSAAAGNVVTSVHREILCVVGLSNGVVESWMISDHKARSVSRSLARMQDTHAPVTQLIRHPSMPSLKVSLKNPAESLFAIYESHIPIVALCEDGTCVAMKMSENGLLKRSTYFMMPSPINNAMCLFSIPAPTTAPSSIPSIGYNESAVNLMVNKSAVPVMECVVVGDFKFHHALPITNLHIPSLWHRSYDDSQLVSHQIEQGPLGASKYYTMTLSLTSSPSRSRRSPGRTRRAVSPTSTLQSSQSGSRLQEVRRRDSEDAIAPVISMPGLTPYNPHQRSFTDSGVVDPTEQQAVRDALEQQSLAEGEYEANLVERSVSTMETDPVDDTDNYVGPMESMQRIVSSELHFAKKDSRLLELFTQHEPAADGTVSPETTADIVFAWLNTDKIAKQNIFELFRLLEIQDTDRLKFVEVAKIAAVVTSAMTKSNTGKPSGRGIAYKQMKQYTTKVTYNAMGEKSVEKILLSKGVQDGIFKGFKSTIRAIWNKQQPRVLTQTEINRNAPLKMTAILQELPKSYAKLLPKGIPLPTMWNPENTHWFHPLRVIRIARMLLDIRSAKQHEVFLSSNLFQAHSSDVTTLQEIMVKYFERNYGDAGNLIDISRHKIAHFLEGCVQYKHHPIVNILQSMLRLDPTHTDVSDLTSETAIWLCVEARSILCSRGCVIGGDLIQPFAEDFGYNKDGAALQARWQYVPKADVLLCADEMLRARGKLGPLMYDQILKIIDEIPSVDSYTSADGQVHKTAIVSPMIDLERFLEVLYHEYIRLDKFIRQAEIDVFGEQSMSAAVTAQTRDITKGKRRLVLDDHISTYGPHHEANMNKIRSWLVEFEPFDPQRTGLVSQEVLRNSVESRAAMIDFLGPRNTPADVYKFIKFACDRFVSADPDGKVSYIDLFAVLCAWEWQTQGAEPFLLPELNKFLPTITRTIEQSYADNLLKYFTHMSSSDNYDPIWVMGAAPEGTNNPYATKSMVKSSSQLARDGFWNKDTNAPQDEPGLLTTQKEPIHNAGQVKVTAAQVALKRERTKLSTDAIPVAPQILGTERVRTTAFGETLQPFRGLAVAPISMHNFDSTLLDPKEVHVRSREVDFARTSYSRSIANISAITYSGGTVGTDDADSYFLHHESPGDLLTAPRPRTPEELRAHLANELDDLASQYISLENDSVVLPVDGGSQHNTNSLVEESLTAATFDSNYQQFSTGLLGTFNMSTSFESIDPSVVKKTLAEEEVSRLRRAQALREKELELLQRAEKEEMEKRREEKLRMREQIRRDMRRKEREGMAYYHAALDIKQKHNDMVRAKMNSIAEAEEADKHAKELEIMRIQQENMARSQMKAFNKTSKANADAESKAEHKELKLMRKEDEVMRKIAKKLAQDEKKLRDAQRKLDQEASDLLTAEMLAQFSASQTESMLEDSNVLTLDTATHESSAYHDEDGDDGHEHDHDDDEHEHEHEEEEGGEDDDAEAGEGDEEEEAEAEPAPVVRAPSPKKEEAVKLSEEEIAAEENRLSAEEEEEMRRQQSAGQRRMSDFLDKIRQSTERHRTHPRRRAKKFSIPLMFSEDIFFDPFEIDLPEEEQENEAEDSSVNMSLLDGSRTTVSKHDDDYYYDPYTDHEPPKDPFYDVNSKLALFRKEEERKRKALFSTTLQEIPSRDWIRVFRTYTVDWDGFFASQAAMVELQNAVRESEEEIELHFRNNDPLKKITDTLSVASPTMSRHSSQLSMHQDRFSDGDSEDQGLVSVTPLPYGKILDHQKVQQGMYRYFRIDQEKQSALLTVEIQCLSGLVDLYLAFQKLPSMVMHDRHIACTKDNKIARLAFRPHKSGTFFIAVRSHETDAKFNIWTYKASNAAEQSPIIGRVNNILRKFEILSSVDEEQLQEFFPKFEKEANKIVAEEIAERQQQDEAASLQEEYEKQQREQHDDDDSIDELYDIESVDRFIAKVSKYTLQGDQAARDDREDYQVGLGDEEEEEELAQEYGQELEDMFMPMHSKSMADLMLDEPSNTEDSSPRASTQGDQSLPPISRAYSVPSMNFNRSSITMDSYLTDDSNLKLPRIKGAISGTGTSTTTHSTSKRLVPKSRSSISVAREYAALDRALSGALAAKGIVERKKRPENPYLKVVPKPVQYQLSGPHY